MFVAPALVAPALVAVLALGCGSSPPPTELVDARRSYEEASGGEVIRVVPVEVEEAREALARAEASFDDDPESSLTRDLSYISLRKAERAHARAAAETARQHMEGIQREQEELEAEYMRRTQRQLTVTQEALEEERRRLSASAEELERRQEQLAATNQELDRERQAREQAERETAAALESLRQVAQVQEEQRGIVITLSGAVLFRSGSADLLPIAREKLDQVAQTLNDHERRTILVEGHTDSRGSTRTNERLSQQRADIVREHLVSRGVAAARIRAVGLGSGRPIADNNSAEGRANNRRVEIIVEPER
jgi:outer membrane protein OmpA-like peptidoglycan-associated protein